MYDEETLTYYGKGKEIELTLTEGIIFNYLLIHKHSTVFRTDLEALLTNAYSSVNSAISRIRAKLNKEITIKTIFNVGYRLEAGKNQIMKKRRKR